MSNLPLWWCDSWLIRNQFYDFLTTHRAVTTINRQITHDLRLVCVLLSVPIYGVPDGVVRKVSSDLIMDWT